MKPNIVWFVCADGGWEPDPVLSVWLTEQEAEAEATRLGARAQGTYHKGSARVVEVKVGQSIADDGFWNG